MLKVYKKEGRDDTVCIRHLKKKVEDIHGNKTNK